MQDPFSTTSTFNQLFGPIDRKVFLQEIQEAKADKYTKKLFSDRLFFLIASAQMEQCKSLGEISSQLHDEAFGKAVGISSVHLGGRPNLEYSQLCSVRHPSRYVADIRPRS